jgi:hypothetical protein
MESGNEKTPQERLKENVIRGNEEFVLDLEGVASLDEIIEILDKHTYVEEGEHLVFEVGHDEDGNPDLTQAFSVEELKNALKTFRDDPPSDALSVDEWFDHRDINAAVKRIFKL